MTYRGHVRNGVVVLDEPAELPEGTEVRVEPASRKPRRSLADRLRHLIGTVTTLQEDMAEHHDHYLHGRPKQ